MENEKINLEEVSKKECNCQKCGKSLEFDAKFCSNCGSIVELQEEESICQKCGIELNEDANFCQKCGTSKKSKILNTNDNLEISKQDIVENKNIAMLCYLGLFMLIPYLTKPNSNFIKYHSNQGLLLLILGILSSLIMIIPILGWGIGFMGYILVTVLFFIGIKNVLKGEVRPLPLIGKYMLIK